MRSRCLPITCDTFINIWAVATRKLEAIKTGKPYCFLASYVFLPWTKDLFLSKSNPLSWVRPLLSRFIHAFQDNLINCGVRYCSGRRNWDYSTALQQDPISALPNKKPNLGPAELHSHNRHARMAARSFA